MGECAVDETQATQDATRDARLNYAKLAKAFQTSYTNAHGRRHPEYPHATPDDEQKLLYLTARLHCALDQAEHAVAALDHLTHTAPDHLLARILLAKIRIGQGRYADARRALDRAVALQPLNWQAHLLRLLCHSMLGTAAELDAAEAAESRRAVCDEIRRAAAAAGAAGAADALCSASDRLPLCLARAAAAATDDAACVPLGAALASAERRRTLAREGHVVLPAVLSRPVSQLARHVYRHLRADPLKHASFQPKSSRFEFRPEVLASYLNIALTPLASALRGRPVVPTYSFPIAYEPGGSIHPHVDVQDNEMSLTYQVELEGGAHSDWPLAFLDPRGTPLTNLDASRASWVRLHDGDGALYFGPRVVHWREPQPSRLMQIVFAWRTVNASSCAGQ